MDSRIGSSVRSTESIERNRSWESHTHKRPLWWLDGAWTVPEYHYEKKSKSIYFEIPSFPSAVPLLHCHRDRHNRKGMLFALRIFERNAFHSHRTWNRLLQTGNSNIFSLWNVTLAKRNNLRLSSVKLAIQKAQKVTWTSLREHSYIIRRFGADGLKMVLRIDFQNKKKLRVCAHP